MSWKSCCAGTRISNRVGAEGVARATHRTDRVWVGAADQRLAQPPHVDVDGAPVDESVAPPDTVEQLLAREHPARVLHEEYQQLELGRPEPHLAGMACDAVSGAVEDNIAPPQGIGDA